MNAILLCDEKLETLTPLLSDILSSAFSNDHIEVLSFNKASFLNTETVPILPDVCFIHVPSENDDDDRTIVRLLRSKYTAPILLLIEKYSSLELCHLLDLGATDFIMAPFDRLHLLPRLWRLREFSSEEEHLLRNLKETLGLNQFIGGSEVFLTEIKKIPVVARTDASVFIAGETGTGKELCARAIHYLSARTSKPFVPVNCGAIPVELVENELFGHESGAYTSATGSKEGLVKEADGGTLFLDEIDCLSPQSQTKLLRFLQEKEYRPLGSSKTFRVDVRVISASNAMVEKAIANGRLRRDLYYRLNVVPLTMSALRHRRSDIPLLAKHFLKKYSDEIGKKMTGFSEGALAKLVQHDWPGNVRELEFTIERAVVLSQSARIQIDDIILLLAGEENVGTSSFKILKARTIAEFEKSYIEKLLIAHNGNIAHAAIAANKNRRAFWQLIRKYHIDVAMHHYLVV